MTTVDPPRKGRPKGVVSKASVEMARQYCIEVCLKGKKPARAAEAVAAFWKVEESTVYKAARRHEKRFAKEFADHAEKSIREFLIHGLTAKLQALGCSSQHVSLVTSEVGQVWSEEGGVLPPGEAQELFSVRERFVAFMDGFIGKE